MAIKGRLKMRRIQTLLGVTIVLAVLALVPTVASANHPYGVLLVKADGANMPTALQAALRAQPTVSAADVFDGGVATPTAEQLRAYDVVVAYSNTDYQDAAALGDNLADYVDAGGVVVTLTFDGTSMPNRTLGGRWVSGNHRTWIPGPTVNSVPQTLGLHDTSHPLMQGVNALGATYRIGDLTLAPGATQLAAWSSGSPLVAYKGRVVGVNAYLGSEEWSGDFARLILNAADWLYPHPPGAPPPSVDEAKPRIAGVSLMPKAFKAAARDDAKRGGTKVTFHLSEAATVRLTVQRRARGRKAARRCVAPRPRNRGAHSCVRWLKVEGSVSHAGVAGSNSLRFTGRLRGRKLVPGRYRLAVVATDAAGNRSKPSQKGFRVETLTRKRHP